MTTRRNHGGHVQRRRDMALYNLATRLRINDTHKHGGGRKLNEKDIERMKAEIDVLKQRGATL